MSGISENQVQARNVRVLISKPGLDGHDRGAKVIARAFRDAGCEVIYSGLRQSPASVATSAVQEDVDILGMSILSGAHNSLVPAVIDKIEEHGMSDVTVIVGGIIPEEDVENLRAAGVDGVFGPGSSTEEIVDFALDQKREEGQSAD